MLDLTIDRLQLNMTVAAGQEQHVEGIIRRALDLLAAGLDERGAPGPVNLASLSLPDVQLDTRALDDEQAARTLATAWLDALALKLRL